MGKAFFAGMLCVLALIAIPIAIVATSGDDDSDEPTAATVPPTTPAPAPATTSAASSGAPKPAKPRWPRRTATDYQMFTRGGNRAMRRVIRHAARLLRAGASRERVMRTVAREFQALEDIYREAGDTAVREAFADELDRWLTAAGYEPIEAYDEFAF